MENSTEFFRRVLHEFKTADSSLTSELKRIEEQSAARCAMLVDQAREAERFTTVYLKRVRGQDSNRDVISHIPISSEIDNNLRDFRKAAEEIQNLQREIDSVREHLTKFEAELADALAAEEKAREIQRRTRRNRIITRGLILTGAACAAVALHFWLLRTTTLTFGITVDGKSSVAGQTAKITLDGRDFTPGGKTAPGHHRLTINMENVETINRDFWMGYGHKDLGGLSLESSKGGVVLISEPPDADFDLSGNGNHWQGKLPWKIENVPVGKYSLSVNRKGWQLKSVVTVARALLTTNKTEFQYGSIEVTSTPSDLSVLMDNQERGKTPAVIREVRPGSYTIVVTDGENQQRAVVTVEWKESVKRDFAFHYGSVKLESTPTGANVMRNGKDLGKTPLVLNRIPAGSLEVTVDLYGYASTNVPLVITEQGMANYAVKLFSEGYASSMKEAQAAFSAKNYFDASNAVNTALELEPNDPAATKFKEEIFAASANAERYRKEAAQKAEIERKEAARKAELARKESEHKEVIDIINRAIDVSGGPDAINRFRSFKLVARALGRKNGVEFMNHFTCFIALPDRIRIDDEVANQPKSIGPLTLTLNADKRTFNSSFCVTENGSWQVADSILGVIQQTVSANVQKHFRHILYITKCKTLIPLLNSDYTLEKVSAPPSAPMRSSAIRAKKDGMPDVTLYFDTENGLLVGIDSLGYDDRGHNLQQTERYEDYHSYSGLMWPTTTKFVQEGGTVSNSTLESIEPLSQYAVDTVFVPPPKR